MTKGDDQVWFSHSLGKRPEAAKGGSMKIEPVAFACESTIKLLKELGPTAHVWPLIRTTTSKDWNCEFPLYTEAQLRQLGDACAAVCEDVGEDEYPFTLEDAAKTIRNLIKEMLP